MWELNWNVYSSVSQHAKHSLHTLVCSHVLNQGRNAVKLPLIVQKRKKKVKAAAEWDDIFEIYHICVEEGGKERADFPWGGDGAERLLRGGVWRMLAGEKVDLKVIMRLIITPDLRLHHQSRSGSVLGGGQAGEPRILFNRHTKNTTVITDGWCTGIWLDTVVLHQTPTEASHRLFMCVVAFSWHDKKKKKVVKNNGKTLRPHLTISPCLT